MKQKHDSFIGAQDNLCYFHHQEILAVTKCDNAAFINYYELIGCVISN